jgi:hypothetical protein
MNLCATIANSLWGLANVPAYLAYRRALWEPGVVQRRRLSSYFRASADTAFGRTHGLAEVRNYEDFARRVPLRDYEEHFPWIERIRRGEPNVLTRDPVTHLVPTSGSTSARKLIPFTRGLQREFNAGIAPWLCDLCLRIPGLIGGPAYWSITPALQARESELSTVPIGFETDSAYLGSSKQRLVNAVMAVPAAVQDAASLDAFRYATLLALLRCRELRLISVWHPSFLALLLDALLQHWEQLIQDVAGGGCICSESFPESARRALVSRPLPKRARELRGLNPLRPEMIWPKLQLISSWGDGAAAMALDGLRPPFPRVRFQAKGLLATEAFVTLPFGEHHPLAISSHFFEFMDDKRRMHLADDLREGEEYEVVVTTGGGLWRYRLGDRVAVDGRVGRTPSLRFVGRAENVSDRFGEKLSEGFAGEVLGELFQGVLPRFALLAPDEDAVGCRYTLYIEGAPPPDCQAGLDRALRRNPQYAWCRDLGQLLPPRLFVISRDGFERFVQRQSAGGARLGDIKPAVLNRRSGWSEIFEGHYAPQPAAGAALASW